VFSDGGKQSLDDRFAVSLTIRQAIASCLQLPNFALGLEPPAKVFNHLLSAGDIPTLQVRKLASGMG